jgi:hypothetical protein
LPQKLLEPVAPETAGTCRAGHGDGERCHGALLPSQLSSPSSLLLDSPTPNREEDNERLLQVTAVAVAPRPAIAVPPARRRGGTPLTPLPAHAAAAHPSRRTPPWLHPPHATVAAMPRPERDGEGGREGRRKRRSRGRRSHQHSSRG